MPSNLGMRPRLCRLATLFVLVNVFGCATVIHNPILTTAADVKARGIRYYRSAPYLLVWQDGKGGLGWDIQFLPDQTQLMEARPTQFLASIQDGGEGGDGLTFENGVLINAEAAGDATKVPIALIKAGEAVATKLGPGFSAGTKKPTNLLPPRLYRIVVKPTGIEFVGGAADTEKIFVGNAAIHGLDVAITATSEGASE